MASGPGEEDSLLRRSLAQYAVNAVTFDCVSDVVSGAIDSPAFRPPDLRIPDSKLGTKPSNPFPQSSPSLRPRSRTTVSDFVLSPRSRRKGRRTRPRKRKKIWQPRPRVVEDMASLPTDNQTTGKFKYLRPQRTWQKSVIKIKSRAGAFGNSGYENVGASLLFLTTMCVSGCMPITVTWTQGGTGSYPFLVSVWMIGLKLQVCFFSWLLYRFDKWQRGVVSDSVVNGDTLWWTKWRHGLLMLPPAVLYTVSDLLMFPILALTDAATYAVLRQTKIILTALLYRFGLKRHISFLQWVAVVQLLLSALLYKQVLLQAMWAGENTAKHKGSAVAIGLILIKITCDAAAVVWSDWSFKSPTTKKAISFPELQMFFALWTFLFSLLYCAFMDGSSISRGDLNIFTGFEGPALVSMTCFAMYGMLMSLFMKYLDSLTKLFMDIGAILVTSSIDVCVFGATLSVTQYFAAAYIIIAAFVFKLGTVVASAKPHDALPPMVLPPRPKEISKLLTTARITSNA